MHDRRTNEGQVNIFRVIPKVRKIMAGSINQFMYNSYALKIKLTEI